jgi:hypothetical protein
VVRRTHSTPAEGLKEGDKRTQHINQEAPMINNSITANWSSFSTQVFVSPSLVELNFVTMSKFIVTTTPFPFDSDVSIITKPGKKGVTQDVEVTLKNVRGCIPSFQTSRLRTMMLEASKDPSKIVAHCCSYDGLSSRLVEEAGFPVIFLGGYAVSSAYGLPDTGYTAMAEMCDKIQETVRQTTIPIFADGDTGYGSPMNVKRTVQSFAEAGASGIMIEDQTWPKSKCKFVNVYVLNLF